MPRRSIAQIWTVFIAAATGVVVASSIGGSWPAPWLLGVLVIVAISLSVVSEARQRGRRNKGSVTPLSPRVQPPPQKARPARKTVKPPPDEDLNADDLALLEQIADSLSSTRVQWLRTNDFETPWPSSHVRPLGELRQLVAAALDRSSASLAEDSLIALAVSLDRFAGFYFANTLPDPLVQGDQWRFFGWPPQQPDPAGGTWRAAAARLRSLAVAVTDAYLAFTATLSASSATHRNGSSPEGRTAARSKL